MSDAALPVMEAGRGAVRKARGVPGVGRWELGGGTIAFVVLTAGIFWYQFHRIDPGEGRLQWANLRWGYLGFILLCLPLESVFSAVRTWIVYRTLEPSVRLWTCLKGECVNVALNTLTPSHLGGGPGQVYIFSREGVPAGRALTASLLSFVGTMVGLLCLGLYSMLVPSTDALRPLFEATGWTLGAISSAMMLAALAPGVFRIALACIARTFGGLGTGRQALRDWWPPEDPRTGPPAAQMGPLTGRLADLIYAYHADVRRFFRAARASVVLVCLLGVAFLMARAFLAYLCLRFLGVDASSMRHILEVQMALIFLVFFAPTPGGAGLAEGASLALMGGIVPVAVAPYYNLLWRLSTVYAGTMFGLCVLARAVWEDTGGLIRRRPDKGE